MNQLRVLPVVLSGFLLSGCILPPQLTVASWAIDGLTMMFTKKSITDHGISAIAQKDCALWRGFTEGAICREDDSITAIADAGNVVEDGKLATSASLAGGHAPDGKALYNRSILSDLAFDDKLLDNTVSWQNDLDVEPVAVSVAAVTVEPLPVVDTPKVEQTASAAPQAAAKPETASLGGKYLVIGSFGKWSNATRFADRYSDLGAQIVSAKVNSAKVYRILVGPYISTTKADLLASLDGVGIKDAWGMAVSENSVALNWKENKILQLANLAIY